MDPRCQIESLCSANHSWTGMCKSCLFFCMIRVTILIFELKKRDGQRICQAICQSAWWCSSQRDLCRIPLERPFQHSVSLYICRYFYRLLCLWSLHQSANQNGHICQSSALFKACSTWQISMETLERWSVVSTPMERWALNVCGMRKNKQIQWCDMYVYIYIQFSYSIFVCI